MAVDYFLKLDGIEGESQAENHKNEIQILSWSWGSSNSTSFAHGTGGGAGKVTVGDISIMKHVDKSSSKLFQFLTKGTHIKSGLLTAQKAGGGDTGYIFLKMQFDGLMVASQQTGGTSASTDMPTESISLAFAKVTFEYQQQNTANGAVTSTGPVSYDLQLAKSA